MAQAMIAPLITQKLQAPSSINAFDVSDEALKQIEELYPGVQVSNSIQDSIKDANLIVYAVKPQNVGKVHAEIRRAKEEKGSDGVRDDAIILSVAAGTPISNFVEGSLVEKVARSMPNTPAQSKWLLFLLVHYSTKNVYYCAIMCNIVAPVLLILFLVHLFIAFLPNQIISHQTIYYTTIEVGAGVTVWGCTENINADERKKIKAVLDSFGKSVFVDDEKFIDMSTSISGSGPAYIFLLMEAMIDAGVHMGFSRETATVLVHHTLLGSTKFAMETGEHPAVLRNSVTSPAGTTASAIYELENGKFRTVIKDAIWACYRRSLEMGGKCSQVGPNRVSTDTVLGMGGPLTSDKRSHHPVEPPMGEMKTKS